MPVDFIPTKFRCERSINFLLILCLSVLQVVGRSEAATTGGYTVQIACQAWREEDQKFLARVLILEQLTKSNLDSQVVQKWTSNSETSVATGHQTPRKQLRLRIYNNVSLISNLPQLTDHDAGSSKVTLRPDGEQTDLEKTAPSYNKVRNLSLSMGAIDEDFIASLRGREASEDVRGRRMDYTGTGNRVGSRFIFRSTWSQNSEKNFIIFLKSSMGLVNTGRGLPDSPEDGPYLCRGPILFSDPSESRSSCMEGIHGHFDFSTLARNFVLVRGIQLGLTREGINPGPIDGILGARTAAALREWQTVQGDISSDTLQRDALCSLFYGPVQP